MQSLTSIVKKNKTKDALDLLRSGNSASYIAEKDERGMSPFLWACAKGNKDVIKEILDLSKEEAILKDNNNNTPIHFAARNNHAQILPLLLKAGANCQEANSDGSTALHWAAGSGFKDVCIALLQDGNVHIKGRSLWD